MPLYENVFLVRPDVSASQVEALTQEFSTIIQESGGTVPKVEQWGLRTLAYRLKKNRKAHYVLMNIDASTGAVHEMERNMRIHEDVLRHLTIRVEELEEGPSAIVQSRGSRDDRDRGGRDRGGRPPYDRDRDRNRDRERSEGTEQTKTDAPAAKEEAPAPQEAAPAAEGDEE